MNFKVFLLVIGILMLTIITTSRIIGLQPDNADQQNSLKQDNAQPAAEQNENASEEDFSQAVSLDNVLGFKLNTNNGGIYSYSSLMADHSVTVAEVDNIAGHVARYTR